MQMDVIGAIVFSTTALAVAAVAIARAAAIAMVRALARVVAIVVAGPLRDRHGHGVAGCAADQGRTDAV
jgi:hypothetical protein